MRFGLTTWIYADFADPRTVATLAREAELAGWDGFFVWDHLASAGSPAGISAGTERLADPWITLAAIAIATERIRIGPMVTPLPRRRPWKVAREAVTLDHLSGGRLILSVGAGFPGILEEEFARFGEETDARARAAMLDEGMQVIAGLWSGAPFAFDGVHYRLRDTVFLPTPVQTPRIPLWVAGTWPHKAPFRRAARWDGVRVAITGGALTPEDVREMVAYIGEHREADTPFDVVVSAPVPREDPAEAADIAARFADAGGTWWLDLLAPSGAGIEATVRRIRRGPPRRPYQAVD